MVKPFIRLTYGELLHLFRTRRKMTLKSVAQILDVTPDTIKNYELDHTFPSYSGVMKLNKLYGDEFEKLATYILSTGGSKKKFPPSAKIRFESSAYTFYGSLASVKRIKASERLLFTLLNP